VGRSGRIFVCVASYPSVLFLLSDVEHFREHHLEVLDGWTNTTGWVPMLHSGSGLLSDIF
jgi:hypothetical protein